MRTSPIGWKRAGLGGLMLALSLVALTSGRAAADPIAYDSADQTNYAPQPNQNWTPVNGGSGYLTWTVLGGAGGGGTYMEGDGVNGRQVEGSNSFAVYAGEGSYAISRPLSNSIVSGEFDVTTRFDIDGSGPNLVSIRVANNTDSFANGELLSFGIVDTNQLSYTDGSGSHLLDSGEARGSVWAWSIVFDADAGTYTGSVTNVSGGFAASFSGNLELSGTNAGSFAVINSSAGDDQNLIFDSLSFHRSPFLRAYLKFDESSGTKAVDATGNGWNGTLVNGATFAAGFSNNAVSLNGSNQYVALPNGIVRGMSDFTIATWVKLNSMSTGARIFDFGNDTNSYMFLTPQSNSGAVRFAITVSGNGNEQQIDGLNALPANQWHHVAITLSGTTGILYVDGLPVGTNNAMTLKPAPLGNTRQNWIGRSQFAGDPYLNGEVDDFRIYDGALSASNVQALATVVAPAFITAPINLLVAAGSNATFSAAVTGTAPLAYQWQFNGTNLTDNARISGSQTATLTITGAQFSDQGAYTLIVTNAAGPLSATVSLTVQAAPPAITGQPHSLGVSLGAGVSFSVTATGSAPLVYQWQFNGVNLDGATSSSLSLPSVVLGNSGNYKVLVTNVYGAATSSVATLAIMNPPSISQPPASAQVQVGGSASFKVVAFSSGLLSYQWLLEGDPIAGATRSSFTLNDAQLTDAGNYSVLVSNLAGTATSQNATLLVVPAPPSAVVQSSYAVQVQAGLNLIANQLDQGGNTLAEILPVAPQGTVVSKYDNANGTWTQATYSNSAWMPSGILSLNPGEGAWLLSPTNFTATFTGLPHTPSLPLAIPSGAVWLVSRQTNDVGTYENIFGAPPIEGAQVFQWNRTNQSFDTFTYTGSGWSGGQAPAVAVGESVWLAPQGGAPVPTPTAPQIIQQPVGAVVGLGDTVTFMVAATGSQPLSYQWRLNNNAISGATTTSITLQNVQPGNAGNYDVVVNNAIGLAKSQVASLAISNLVILPFADNFTNAGTLGSVTNGSGFGSNVGATIEPGEPNPDDIPGGASVWLRWQPAVDGLASFTTAGSDFDTVLAIYTSAQPGLPALANLALVTADDDGAAFLCSLVNFTASAGTTYYIQVDGYHGASGNIKLSWNFTPTANFPPVILSQPQGQTVIAGSNLTLSVVVQEGPLVSYQWFSNYVALSGATGPNLVMTPAQAGIYVVGVTNMQTQAGVLSMPADVQLITPGVGQYGNPANVRAQDKLVAASALTPPDPNVPHDPTTASGFTDTQVFSSVGATADPSEPTHCGYLPCHSVWNSFSNNLSGTLTITTVGTTFNAILEAYTGPGDSYDTLVPVACSANHGSAGESITFAYTAGTTIWVVVDGVNCASGNITLNYNNVALPIINVAPVSQAIIAGGQLTLSAAVASPPTLRYQWRMNGNNIAGATTSSLIVRNFQATNQGTYTLFAANGFGSVVSAGAQVVLNNPHFVNPAQSGTNFTATFVGLSNVSYVIQASSDLKTWTPLKTNSSALGLFNFTDPIRSGTVQRYYRGLQR